MTLLRPIPTAALAATALFLAPLAAAQSDDPLRWVPADAEFVAFVDWRGLVDSPIVRTLIEKKTTPEALEAQMTLVKNLTGTNLLTDLDRGIVWGRVADDDSVVVLVEGRFEPEKLVTIIKAAGNYSTVDLAGQTYHKWHDKNEGKDKVGAFLTPGTLAIAGTEAQIEAARVASTTGAGFKSSALATFAPARGSATAFALLTKPNRLVPGGEMKDTLQARAAVATLTFKPDALLVGAMVFGESEDAATKWMQMAEGGRALLQLQSGNPNVSLMARDIVITRGENNAAVVNLSLPNDLLLELADQKD